MRIIRNQYPNGLIQPEKSRGFGPTHAGFITEYYNIGDNHKPRLENFLCIE